MEAWLKNALTRVENMPVQAKEIRELGETDLYFFAKLLNPGYMYGEVHKEIYMWMQNYTVFGQGGDALTNKLIMLPRAHLKSHMVAVWALWMIVRHPEITMLYVSATADLAEQQLYDIKNMMEGKQFQKYWPEFINPEVGKREKWSSTRVIIDHPLRKKEGIRDATISTAGLTTNTTGWHADIIVADDLVVPENAYTEDGRDSVSKKASQFTSIRNTGGFTMACGTRYHPKDVYDVWKLQNFPIYDEESGEQIDLKPVWDVKEYAVEDEDMYIWPRVIRTDGKAFGFDKNSLARIKAEYTDRVQFYAQYYNDPNDSASERISRDKFQYYGPRFLKKEGSRWFYKGKRLNVYAAVDFAFSLSRAADYTAVVVIGIDSDRNIYILDIDRFKTDKVLDYFKSIARLHSKWRFQKLQAEVSVAQKVIGEAIKQHVRKEGMTLSVIEYRPSRAEGSKEERISAAIEHKYDNYEMWHYEGGWIPTLEEELVQARPKHDDIKDALASACTIAVAPSRSIGAGIKDFLTTPAKTNRFGGVAYR